MALKDWFKNGTDPKKKDMRLLMDSMMVQAADMLLDDRVLEEGRKSILEKFKHSNIPYNAHTLGAMKSGMEFISSMRKEEDLWIPLIMTVAKLEQVEKNLEAMPTKK